MSHFSNLASTSESAAACCLARGGGGGVPFLFQTTLSTVTPKPGPKHPPLHFPPPLPSALLSMADPPPVPVDPVAAVVSLLAHAHALAPTFCPSLYPAGFSADVTSMLDSHSHPSSLVSQLQALGKSVGICSPDNSRVIAVFTVDVSRRIFIFSGLKAVPADLVSFAHCDVCTNEASCRRRLLSSWRWP
jgi:hypothetical protein